jgi:hypothetical protein
MPPLLANSVNPPGSDPVETDQRYGAVPPAADKNTVYEAPIDPLGKVDGVEITRLDATASVNCLFAVTEALSVTWAVNWNEPALVGDPLITPLDALIDMPPGNAPAVIDHL